MTDGVAAMVCRNFEQLEKAVEILHAAGYSRDWIMGRPAPIFRSPLGPAADVEVVIRDRAYPVAVTVRPATEGGP